MKKIGLIVLAVIFALGALGFGYAQWTENLVINGNVTAATWDVYFDSAGATPAIGSPANKTNEPIPGMPYATLTTSGAPGDTLTVNINNAYPGLVATVYFDVTTTGSIPITFDPLQINLGTLPAGATVVGSAPAGPIGPGFDTSEGQFTVTIPGSLTLATFVPGTTYTFTVTVTAKQAVP